MVSAKPSVLLQHNNLKVPCCTVLAGEEACFSMHLGAYGQAYFAAETMEIVSGE
jgi:hypothetical protein